MKFDAERGSLKSPIFFQRSLVFGDRRPFIVTESKLRPHILVVQLTGSPKLLAFVCLSVVFLLVPMSAASGETMAYVITNTVLQRQSSERQEKASKPAMKSLGAGKHEVVFKNDAIKNYIVNLPENYSPENTYPMIVAFHGAVGNAESAYRRWAESSEGFILVCPQGTARMGWQIGNGQMKSILACVENAQKRFGVNSDRIYLTGHSMGGHVSWNLATFHADRFAAVAPTASTPMYTDKLDQLLSLPIYVVHGRKDNIVGIAKNQRAEKYINAHGGSMTLVVIEDAGHGFVAEQRKKIIEFFNQHR